ncbi:hypothetical protein COCC4DRAFT_130744, partial [Bipolaris maydis ATCC 48331]
KKTYNSGDSPVVSHLTTSPPVKDLTCGERTRASDLFCRWSYVPSRWKKKRYHVSQMSSCWRTGGFT